MTLNQKTVNAILNDEVFKSLYNVFSLIREGEASKIEDHVSMRVDIEIEEGDLSEFNEREQVLVLHARVAQNLLETFEENLEKHYDELFSKEEEIN